MSGDTKMTIEATGRINEAGKLEVELPERLPPGTIVHVTIELLDPDPAYFWASAGQEGKPKADDPAITENTNHATAPGGLLEEVDSIDEP
jgi:hypothetical protein